MIIVGAPHTSNWDFILFLGALHAYRIRASFIGKHTLFRPPFGFLFQALGGIPIDRSRAGGLVAQVAEAFAGEESMVLVIAPEGTRRAAPFWKSGFLSIAEAAGVPIVPAGVDYPNRRVTLGEPLRADAETMEIMGALRDFYADKHGLHSEGKGPVAVAGESS